MDTENLSSSTSVGVLIVDDHPAVRQGLGLLLETEGIHVCAQADGRTQALMRMEECRPDLALVDLSIGDGDGLALIPDLLERGLPSLVYTMHEDGWHVDSAFAAGAHGYVTKREVQGVLVRAICEVAAGRHFISPRAAMALADRVTDGAAK